MIRLLEQARVLVTGATGFVGQHLCRELAALGTATYGLSRSASRDTLPVGVIPIAADVTRRDEVIAALKQARPSQVVHLATVGATENKDFMASSAVDDPRENPRRPRLSLLCSTSG